jgi:hypothetical protein
MLIVRETYNKINKIYDAMCNVMDMQRTRRVALELLRLFNSQKAQSFHYSFLITQPYSHIFP